MNALGIIEGFFGPQWPNHNRKSYARFLEEYGGDFFIYAPKQDPHLRKQWRHEWDSSYLALLKDLVETFHHHKISFGVGFSPFGLGTKLEDQDKKHLQSKIEILNDLGIDLLGLFFDDMPTNDNLAKTQIEVLSLVKKYFKGKIIFCPSYYTPDPLLDKVFGPRPVNYLQEIANGIPLDVAIAWTGPKVISPEISAGHLVETRQVLKRRPFIWENLFANDGPKNCKFLKLKAFSGRSPEAFELSEGFGFNMMNQPELSKIVYLASKYVLEGESDADQAFEKALSALCSPNFKEFILKNRDSFLNVGLDNMGPEVKSGKLTELAAFKDAAASEISDWIAGKYLVGSECLTD